MLRIHAGGSTILMSEPVVLVATQNGIATVTLNRPEKLNALNRELLMRLQEKGIAAPSVAILDGKFAIRISICNHRTRREDFDLFLREVLRLGLELEQSAA